METTSYKDFLYSVEAEVAEKKKQVEKQNVSASKPVDKNSHMVAAKKAEKPSVFDQLKELPGKVDNLNKRFKLWKNQRKNLGFYKRYLDRVESGLYSRYGSESYVFENEMIDDPVNILKGPAQEYIRDIVADVNKLFKQVLDMSKALETKTTAEGAISVVNGYVKEYIGQNIKGQKVDQNKLSWRDKILNATKFKIANILLRYGKREVYGYTAKNMVLKGYPPANHLIVTMFVSNPEEHPSKRSVTSVFTSPESFRILADSDKQDVFSVVGMTTSVLSKTVDGKVMNDIKLSKSNAIKEFKASNNPNKSDEAKIIDSIWDGINVACKELLGRKSYFIDCINVYYDMILRIDRLAVLAIKSMLDTENASRDKGYKNGAQYKRDTNDYRDGQVQTATDRKISRLEEKHAGVRNGKLYREGLNSNAHQVNEIAKKVNKMNR